MSVTLFTRISIIVASLFDIIPGFIHYVTSDGGANSIAGIVLEWDNATSISVEDETWNASDYHKETVLVMFAALGLIQIKLGVVTALMAYWLPQDDDKNSGIILFRFTWLLVAFQLFKILMDIVGYRNIHSVAPHAPGGYKSPVIMVFYLVAVILQMVWYRSKR
jgi:hypothetical protein